MSILKEIVEHNEKWSDPDYCLKAVQENSMNLKYARVQTPEICLAAVKQDGFALEYVREQTPEICLAAVQNEGDALYYIKEQTPEICAAAIIKSSYYAYKHVRLPRDEKARDKFIRELALLLN